MTVGILFWIFIATLAFSVFAWTFLDEFFSRWTFSVFSGEDLAGVGCIAMAVSGWVIIFSHLPKISIGA